MEGYNATVKASMTFPAPPTQTMPVPAPNKPQAVTQATFNGGFGSLPEVTYGMSFTEIGQSGLRQFSGYVREEFLPQLVGRQGAQKYREMMDNNPVVGAIMFAITSTMRKVQWRVKPPDDGPGSAEMVEFVEGLMQDMSHTWEDLIVENLSMLGYGFAPHEIVYKKRMGLRPGLDPSNSGRELPGSRFDDGRVGWRRIPLRSQDTLLKWFFDANGQAIGMTQQPWVGQIVNIPIEKMLLFRPTIHKNNPEGRSILRNAYRPYWFIKRLEEQEAILFERLNGVPVIKVPGSLLEAAAAGDSRATASLNNFKRMAVNIRVDEQMGLVMPSDVYPGTNGPSTVQQYSFELVTPTSGRQSVNANETIGRYNTSILTSVLADFITMGHDTRGAQNLGETKMDLFYLAIESYMNSMASVYNRYALPRLWDLNAFDRDTMPELVPDLAQRVDLDLLSNFVLRMTQAGMPMFPDEDLQEYLRDAAGLPDVTDDAAIQAAGLLQEQLDRDDEHSDAALEQALNPDKGKPKTPLEKIILGSLARRIIHKAGPRYGIRTTKARPAPPARKRFAGTGLRGYK